MSKIKFKSNDLKFLSVIIGVLATLMILLPALLIKDSETSLTGFQVAFGHKFASLGSLANGEIKLNILAIIGYILPICASLILLFTKKGYLISTVMFGAATVILFLLPNFTVVTVTVFGIVNEVSIDWAYGIGLIIAISFSLLGLLVGLYKIQYKN